MYTTCATAKSQTHFYNKQKYIEMYLIWNKCEEFVTSDDQMRNDEVTARQEQQSQPTEPSST